MLVYNTEFDEMRTVLSPRPKYRLVLLCTRPKYRLVLQCTRPKYRLVLQCTRPKYRLVLQCTHLREFSMSNNLIVTTPFLMLF